MTSHEDSAGEFCCAGSISLTKLLGFMSKAMKLLLTELVGQCRNISPLAFSALTSLRSVNTEKDTGNIIFLLTGLRIYTGEYKAQGPTLCPTEGRTLRGPQAWIRRCNIMKYLTMQHHEIFVYTQRFNVF